MRVVLGERQEFVRGTDPREFEVGKTAVVNRIAAFGVEAEIVPPRRDLGVVDARAEADGVAVVDFEIVGDDHRCDVRRGEVLRDAVGVVAAEQDGVGDVRVGDCDRGVVAPVVVEVGEQDADAVVELGEVGRRPE
ncbi:hypothetical protein OV090_40395 [Nannocystis sp. RBIL2]|uniref:hypothetical protein n=1 Tax=Nannocystis sp. RBIL2 TaxID=2996788 RepID=UPI002271FFE2|nr:hypothetical protein [Nannocystis sp. RBIL2]MCY1071072.1 hypothetical protein [Nannocystis sp. RBIL2]